MVLVDKRRYFLEEFSEPGFFCLAEGLVGDKFLTFEYPEICLGVSQPNHER